VATSRSGASISGRAHASAALLADSSTNIQTSRCPCAMISSTESVGGATVAVSPTIWNTGGLGTGIVRLVDTSSSHRRTNVAAAREGQACPSRAFPPLSRRMPVTPGPAPRLSSRSAVRATGTVRPASAWCTGPRQSVSAALRNRRRGQSAWSFRTASATVETRAASPMQSR
jgi:hypothetical protein